MKFRVSMDPPIHRQLGIYHQDFVLYPVTASRRTFNCMLLLSVEMGLGELVTERLLDAGVAPLTLTPIGLLLLRDRVRFDDIVVLNGDGPVIRAVGCL